MKIKPLAYGLIGFFLGSVLAAAVATVANRPVPQTKEPVSVHYTPSPATMEDMTMEGMSMNLEGKTGDEYDRAFLAEMIVHHEGAVDMVKLAATNAKHDEIKALSASILATQEKEIKDMKRWQKTWGY